MSTVLRRHRSWVDTLLMAVCAALALFVCGFLIGQLTEPVPGHLAAIPNLAWFVPLLVGSSVVVPLLRVNGTVRRQSRVGSPAAKPVLVEADAERGKRGQPARHAAALASIGEDSGLSLFPREDPDMTQPRVAVRIAS
jgi:hypothetical protein